MRYGWRPIAGDWSDDTVTAHPGTTQVGLRLPAAPANVSVVGEGLGSVTVGWEPPADDGGSPVAGYEVWYVRLQDRNVPGSYVMSSQMLPADARQHTVTGLVDYQRYEVIGLFGNEWGLGDLPGGVVIHQK